MLVKSAPDLLKNKNTYLINSKHDLFCRKFQQWTDEFNTNISLHNLLLPTRLANDGMAYHVLLHFLGTVTNHNINKMILFVCLFVCCSFTSFRLTNHINICYYNKTVYLFGHYKSTFSIFFLFYNFSEEHFSKGICDVIKQSESRMEVSYCISGFFCS